MADAPRRRWLTWALVASLGLNLTFAGLVAGTLLKGPPPPMLGVGQYARALPEPYRRDLGRALRDGRPDWPAVRDAWRGRRAALATALTAEPYDPAAVAGLLDQDRAIAGEIAARGAALLLDEIDRMSTAERTAYAARLAEDPPGRDHHR